MVERGINKGGEYRRRDVLKFISFTFYCGFHHDLWVKTERPWLPRKSANSFHSLELLHIFASLQSSEWGRCLSHRGVLKAFPLLKYLLWGLSTQFHHSHHNRLSLKHRPLKPEGVTVSIGQGLVTKFRPWWLFASRRVRQSLCCANE